MSIAQSIAEAAVSEEMMAVLCPAEKSVVKSFLEVHEQRQVSLRLQLRKANGPGFDRLPTEYAMFMLFVAEALREDPVPLRLHTLLNIMINMDLASNPPTAEDREAAKKLMPFAQEILYWHHPRRA